MVDWFNVISSWFRGQIDLSNSVVVEMVIEGKWNLWLDKKSSHWLLLIELISYDMYSAMLRAII